MFRIERLQDHELSLGLSATLGSAHARRNSLVSPSHNGKAPVILLSQNVRVAYDDLGNRLTRDGELFTAIFDLNNRLVENQNYQYSYDVNGNTSVQLNKSTGELQYYYWDTENQLTKIEWRASAMGVPTKTVLYTYDVLGRRIEKDVNGVVTRFLYDNEDIIAEYDGNNNLIASFTHGPGIDEPLAMHKNGQDYFYHADGLGSVVGLSNSSGSIVQHYVYGSFGNLLAIYDANGTDVTDAPIVTTPYGFTGREIDLENYSVSDRCGLMYYRSRYYDTCTGRFISEDLIGFAGKSMNLYSYVKNNVVNRKDASGKGGIGVGVGVGVGLCLGLIIRNKVDEIREKEMKEISFQRNLLLNQLDSQLASYIKSREIDSTSARILFDEFQRIKARLNEANSLKEINNLREDAYEAIKIIDQHRFNNGLP